MSSEPFKKIMVKKITESPKWIENALQGLNILDGA
jgi:hypothetical protein